MSSQFTPCPTYKQASGCATLINRSQAPITGPCRPWHSLSGEQDEEQSTDCGQKTCRDCTLHWHQQCSGRQVRVTDDSSCWHRPGDCGALVNVLGLSSPQPCTAACPCCYHYQPPINTYPSLPAPPLRSASPATAPLPAGLAAVPAGSHLAPASPSSAEQSPPPPPPPTRGGIALPNPQDSAPRPSLQPATDTPIVLRLPAQAGVEDWQWQAESR